jgi:hypothetical protein
MAPEKNEITFRKVDYAVETVKTKLNLYCIVISVLHCSVSSKQFSIDVQ